ncbi:hypothetical protein [Burkholderia cenocepacia]|uniref:Uncharacterized protein n=1 Tax=Burkholderia cenocepacia TaxID=95486 RepID=A0ABD4UL99_9BURK|nr:hypothetical protein [Burkholderia cenocepacia]MCW3698957.1 hypothetical protein [Burkholderia cenocepacia]MCW3706575.1 hypothetical protein [Burkholderia cenocepacia]MCW3714934.1 hypothetical protein [Burkholderia cenocepacia]MCW3722750.1 hypothetical protein [Burkholderia cenocepacia]MCW3729804.1 hypothetical protein [Burkholderia cenocepacia]
MSSSPIDLSHVPPYETTFFDDGLPVERNGLDITTLLGVEGDVPNELLVSLCGAPAGSTIQAYLDALGRLIFAVTTPASIKTENRHHDCSRRQRPANEKRCRRYRHSGIR